MKKMKKLAVLFVCVLAVSMLGGCGNSFDASSYLKALLDNSYKNDSSGIVDQKIGTKEEAEQLYNDGIAAEVDATVAGLGLSQDIVDGYTTTYQNIFKNVKYTVKDAAKQSDGSFEVTVECEPLIVFDAAMDDFETTFGQVAQNWIADIEADPSAVPSETEMYETMFSTLKESLDKAIASPSYGETKTVTVTIELSNNTYSPNQKDLEDLEYALIDLEAINKIDEMNFGL